MLASKKIDLECFAEHPPPTTGLLSHIYVTKSRNLHINVILAPSTQTPAKPKPRTIKDMPILS